MNTENVAQEVFHETQEGERTQQDVRSPQISKRRKITNLAELNQADIQKFLFEYSTLRQRDDKMKFFFEYDIYNWIKDELESPSDLDDDAKVQELLEQFCTDLDTRLMKDESALEKAFVWPSKGDTLTRVAQFMANARRIEKRLGEMGPPERTRFNRALFKALPAKLEFHEKEADMTQYNTLRKIHEEIKVRKWALKTDDDHNIFRKVNRVNQGSKKNDRNEDAKKMQSELLDQALQVAAEGSNNTGVTKEINRLKNEIEELKNLQLLKGQTPQQQYVPNHNMQQHRNYQQSPNNNANFQLQNRQNANPTFKLMQQNNQSSNYAPKPIIINQFKAKQEAKKYGNLPENAMLYRVARRFKQKVV